MKDLIKSIKADLTLKNKSVLIDPPIQHIRELQEIFYIRKARWNFWNMVFGLDCWVITGKKEK